MPYHTVYLVLRKKMYFSRGMARLGAAGSARFLLLFVDLRQVTQVGRPQIFQCLC